MFVFLEIAVFVFLDVVVCFVCVVWYILDFVFFLFGTIWISFVGCCVCWLC